MRDSKCFLHNGWSGNETDSCEVPGVIMHDLNRLCDMWVLLIAETQALDSRCSAQASHCRDERHTVLLSTVSCLQAAEGPQSRGPSVWGQGQICDSSLQEET